MKWSEILPQEALDLSVQLENHALEERSKGKILFQNRIKSLERLILRIQKM